MERDISREVDRMESLRVRDRKRFEYGLSRQYLNEAGYHDSDRRRGAGGAGGDHDGSPCYSMEPPGWAATRHQAKKRAASSSAPRRAKAKQTKSAADASKKGAGVQLPSITRKKEPTFAVRNNSKLQGIAGLWGSARPTRLRGEMQFELDQGRQSRGSRPGTGDHHKWEEQEQAGVKFWLNTETGEATVECPSEVRRAITRMRRNSKMVKVHAAATPDEDVTPPPTSSGTRALVYDTAEAQELFRLLDSSP